MDGLTIQEGRVSRWRVFTVRGTAPWCARLSGASTQENPHPAEGNRSHLGILLQGMWTHRLHSLRFILKGPPFDPLISLSNILAFLLEGGVPLSASSNLCCVGFRSRSRFAGFCPRRHVRSFLGRRTVRGIGQTWLRDFESLPQLHGMPGGGVGGSGTNQAQKQPQLNQDMFAP